MFDSRLGMLNATVLAALLFRRLLALIVASTTQTQMLYFPV